MGTNAGRTVPIGRLSPTVSSRNAIRYQVIRRGLVLERAAVLASIAVMPSLTFATTSPPDINAVLGIAPVGMGADNPLLWR
jgi:hypothetical protein